VGDGFSVKYGPWAIVAGASEGLGESFALDLAASGLNLFLIARREAVLDDLSARIAGKHRVEVRSCVADLAAADSLRRVNDETVGLDVGLLVYNAAASAIGSFLETDLETHRGILSVNAAGPTTLCHILGQRMVKRGRGGIVLMTSLSAYQGSALISTYAATKAYLLSLAEALSFELHGTGVDVLACAAGATLTPNYVASQPRKGGLFQPPEMKARDVVHEALSALGRKPVVVAGRRNRISHLILHRLLPRRTAVRIMGRAMQRLYGHQE
jgi:short-subunit dehydrogenase